MTEMLFLKIAGGAVCIAVLFGLLCWCFLKPSHEDEDSDEAIFAKLESALMTEEVSDDVVMSLCLDLATTDLSENAISLVKLHRPELGDQIHSAVTRVCIAHGQMGAVSGLTGYE